MNDKALYDKSGLKVSKLITNSYSTSFSIGIRVLDKKIRGPVYAIYGFVRLADEIVDTFHGYPKEELLEQYRRDTFDAIEKGISMNPVLNSFQQAVREYNIDKELIEAFLYSMKMDLNKNAHTRKSFDRYIFGSAEVVGLMCLKVFCEGNPEMYQKLKPSAKRLGAAFQKINFLRDLHADYKELGRAYFPGVNMDVFDEHTKKEIEKEIEEDFLEGYKGILQLPKSARLGVYIAYVYFYALFKKIRQVPSTRVMQERIRIPNNKKIGLLISSFFRHNLRLS